VNRSEPVPSSAGYVIIGSGLSGALTAFELLKGGVRPEEVIILEAREAVSGASGRNAGHVRPDAFRGFRAYAALHGPDQALKIVANEKLVLERVDDFVRRFDVPCDFNHSTTFDVCLTREFAEYESRSFQEYRTAGGDVSQVQYYDGEEAKEKTGVKDTIAAYEWPAGSIHPAKLTQWLLSDVLEKGVRMWTHCPVMSVDQGQASNWNVMTPRGLVSSHIVIHCTNAYAAALVPQLSRFITPNRAQAHSIVPTERFSGLNALNSTMSLRYSLRHFYSLIQRQEDGTLILGVSRTNPDLSQETYASRITFDDSSFNQEIVGDALKRFPIIFPDSENNPQRHGEGLDHAWTGIIGMTPDSVPCVGAIEDSPGQYICAGFNGHGMARIFTCAPGLARLILGGSWAETGLPECFQYTADRLSRAYQKEGTAKIW